jgi:7-dehydrocholesterol reductase
MYEPKATSWASVLLNEFVSFQLIVTSPLLDWFVLIAYQDFDSSLASAGNALLSEPLSFFSSRLPAVTTTSIAAYLAWVVFQAVLYVLVPGPLHQAPRTPGGRRLLYRLNGFRAWVLTVAVAAGACFAGLIDPAIIAKHWETALTAAMLYSCALIGIFYVKARVGPDNVGDTLLTGKFSANCRGPSAGHCGPIFSLLSEPSDMPRPFLVRPFQRRRAPSPDRTTLRLEALQRQSNRRDSSMDLDV